MAAAPPNLILASGSPYRKMLLERLGVPFRVLTPGVDESQQPGETPKDLAGRLARAKAEALMGERDAVVIGSDQTVTCRGELAGKPGTRAAAAWQLANQSGQAVDFHTGLCVLDTRTGEPRVEVETVRVVFRQLTDGEIQRYLDRDEPFDCAGSFKSESLGIALCERIECEDPTTLVGLPLVRLCRMLREVGFYIP